MILVSWIPAQLSHVYIEEPFRRSRSLNLRPFRAMGFGLGFSLAALAVGLLVGINRIDLDEASESEVVARAAEGPEIIQKSADRIRPLPDKARSDRGPAFSDCLVLGPVIVSPACRFGVLENPAKRIVLLGDSHALQYSPALIRLADERGWQVTVLSRAGCLIADTPFDEHCDRWRQHSLDRISRERPDLTVVATGTTDRYRVRSGDRTLSRKESQPELVAGMSRTLTRVNSASRRVALIRDQARAPFLPFECVAENPDNLEQCVFDSNRRRDLAFDLDGARDAGVPVINPDRKLCRNGKCPSVIGGALVYRDTHHLTATFARALGPWLSRQLPGLGDRG